MVDGFSQCGFPVGSFTPSKVSEFEIKCYILLTYSQKNIIVVYTVWQCVAVCGSVAVSETVA